MDPLTIAFALFGLAVLILGIDLLVPSGGILVVLAFLFSGGSVLFAFRSSYSAGLWMLVAELAAVPIFAWVFIRVWPHTPLGKRVIIDTPNAKPFTWETQKLVGKEGITTMDLLPNGQIELDGHRYDATSQSGIISVGTAVRVINEEMGVLFVVPVAIASNMHVSPTSPHSSNRSGQLLSKQLEANVSTDGAGHVANAANDHATKNAASSNRPSHDIDTPANDIGIQSLD